MATVRTCEAGAVPTHKFEVLHMPNFWKCDYFAEREIIAARNVYSGFNFVVTTD
jgi:hypothetical protein